MKTIRCSGNEKNAEACIRYVRTYLQASRTPELTHTSCARYKDGRKLRRNTIMFSSSLLVGHEMALWDDDANGRMPNLVVRTTDHMLVRSR
jgi:hypothetical protein